MTGPRMRPHIFPLFVIDPSYFLSSRRWSGMSWCACYTCVCPEMIKSGVWVGPRMPQYLEAYTCSSAVNEVCDVRKCTRNTVLLHLPASARSQVSSQQSWTKISAQLVLSVVFDSTDRLPKLLVCTLWTFQATYTALAL